MSQCHQCRFYAEPPMEYQNTVVGGKVIHVTHVRQQGICKRHAPVMTLEGLPRQPQTWWHDHCGEWEYRG